MNNYISLLLVFLLLHSSLSVAEINPSFQEMDINGDGVLSRKETTRKIDDFSFAKADRDGSGAINRQEYLAAMGGRKESQG